MPAADAAGATGVRADVRGDAGCAALAMAALENRVDVVVNCVAISQPRACEEDPEAARIVNSPAASLHALAEAGVQPFFVHISTDQVYAGTKAHWGVGDATEPVNEYGRSKLAAEKDIVAAAPAGGAAILRSSIIYGPATPYASVGRALFLQFVEGALRKGDPTTFFDDEWRCPVFVRDFVTAIEALVERADGNVHTYNFGGPERLSRVDMARAVARVRGLSDAAILPAPAKSVNRGVASPPDISMDSKDTETALGFEMTKFEDALRKFE